MRYLNWDVLLFPDSSKVPMQEFKTGCYVVPDQEQLPTNPNTGASFAFEHLSTPQIPVVACFLANHLDGSPFRVSVHSWERPGAGHGLQGLLLQQGKTLCFEARVFVDGLCNGGMLFLDKGPWPQVLELSNQLDKAGNRDLLRWPKFHPELLTQSYWNAGENLGRIKVTITEGFLQGEGLLPFTKVKNIVTFSFQHAPQHILESSGIAWPNTGMWYQATQPIYNSASPSKRDPYTDELDPHAHSPRRRTNSIPSNRFAAAHPPGPFHTSMLPPPLPGFTREPAAVSWNTIGSMADPFIENSRRTLQNRRTVGRSTDTDQSMPDYSRPLTPANATQASHPSTEHATHHNNNNNRPIPAPNTLDHHPPATLEETLTSIFPDAPSPSPGVSAPTNTRANSAAGTPPFPTRPSFAAEVRAASYNRPRAVSVTPKDGPPPPPMKSRENSDTTMKSHFSDEQQGVEELGGAAGARCAVAAKPVAGDVRGRKEGRGEREREKEREREGVKALSLSRRASRDLLGSAGAGGGEGVVGLGGGDKENQPSMGSGGLVVGEGKRKRVSAGVGVVGLGAGRGLGGLEEKEGGEVELGGRKVSRREDEAGERRVLGRIENLG